MSSTSVKEIYRMDFGFINVPKSATDKTAKFGMYSGSLANFNYTIAGYPIKSGKFDGTQMYSDTAGIQMDFGYCLEHKISICGGTSGSPMFDSNNYAVAIQTYGYSNEATDGAEYATRLTQSAIDFIRNN